ncbi:MAG: hypothetical protein ACI8RZ_000872 [Myxococcota bacterium]|jgi:hypothetical protein
MMLLLQAHSYKPVESVTGTLHLDETTGPLPDRPRLAAEWLKVWQKHYGLSWLDRLLTTFNK